tara:strand:- start:269 stop:1867 length:1599 start_codon:yes stop_codon:yes gene_type:complete
MKVVNLMGRGPSLIRFSQLPKSDHVILANDFAKEITQVDGFASYLEKQDIHLVFNMVHGGDTAYHHIDFFNKFNIVKLIRPYLNGIRVPGSSMQSIPLEEHFLGENHMKFMYTDLKYKYDYYGTGLAAFAYSMLDCSADVVNVVGLDFYKNLDYGIRNYLVNGSEGRDWKVDPGFTPEKMQDNFCRLVKGNPHIQVNLVTACKEFIDGMEDIENLNISVLDLDDTSNDEPELLREKQQLNKHIQRKKKLAVVLGGWHYPYEYYNQVRNQKIPDGWECDYFVVSHRDPELPNVLEEKQVLLKGRSDGILQSFDKELYNRIITKQELKDMGFTYDVEQSSIGDLYQLNQWVKRHYIGQYDKVLFTHDDNYILNDELFLDILEKRVDLFLNSEVNKVTPIEKNFDWKHLSSGVLENTIVPRTSFTFLDKELLDKLAPDFEEVSTKGVDLDRSGETTTIYNLNDEQVDRSPLSSWNCPSRNFKNWMSDNGYTEKSVRMSPLYRVNKYLIEGERGFIWTKEDEERILHNLSQYYDLT